MVEDSDEEDEYVYNPLKLPLGWDGKPIPYWLYKLHGLNLEFKCEICGGARWAAQRAGHAQRAWAGAAWARGRTRRQAMGSMPGWVMATWPAPAPREALLFHHPKPKARHACTSQRPPPFSPCTRSYWGRRAFERHFREWRHENGRRALGIPNSKKGRRLRWRWWWRWGRRWWRWWWWCWRCWWCWCIRASAA